MRRAAIVLLSLSCLACDAIGSLFGSPPTAATPPPEPPPASVEVAAPATAPTPSAAAPTRVALSAEQARARRIAVHEGREAAHDGHHAGALAAFDRALAIEPRNPRLLCESGLVAHQAGDEGLAGRRIDAALSLFGDDDRLRAELHVPVAMCLYNRGLVHQAAGEIDEAAEAFERSIALRTNPVVSARLAALGEAPQDPDAGDDHMSGGVRVTPLRFASLVHAPDEATLLRALEGGLSGSDDFSDGAPTDAEIERTGAAVPLPWAGLSEALLFMADDRSVPIGNRILAVAAHVTSGGYQVVTLPVGGYDATDHGVYGDTQVTVGEIATSATTMTVAIETCGSDGYQSEADPGDVPSDRDDLQNCYETYESGNACGRTLVVCGTGVGAASMRCASLQVQRAPAPTASSEFFCEDESGESVRFRVPYEPTESPAPPFELRCTATDLAHVRCERLSGEGAEDLVGEHTLDALIETDAARSLSTDLRSDEEDDEDEGEPR